MSADSEEQKSPFAQTLPPEFESADIPEIASELVPECPLCRSREARVVAAGHDYELQTCRNLWTFVACGKCGHVRLSPRPTADTLPVIYPPHYYSYDMETNVNPIALRGKAFLDRLKFRSILRHLERAPASYVDIGCGDGKYLKVMAGHGIPRERLYGLELSESAIARLREQGYAAFCERVEDCEEISKGGIDLATMFHVIEHVADPCAVVEKVADWLAPGGVLAIETPNIDALDARLFRDEYWGGYHIPRHWHLFQARTLRQLLENAGLEVTAAQYQTGHSFWMYSLHHVLRYNRRRPLPGLASLFDPLKGLPFLVGFTLFDKLRSLLGARTSSVLMLARKP